MKTETIIDRYINETPGNSSKKLSSGFIAYLAALDTIHKVSPKITKSIIDEIKDQRSNLKMIASENYSSLAVQLSQANLLTDKYAEGIPYHRFYAGCDNIDELENHGVNLAKQLFKSEHAYIQPHSGSDANLIAYWAILSSRIELPYLENIGKKQLNTLSNSEWNTLKKQLGNQKLLSMSYDAGGHLTHGYRYNVSSRMFTTETYSVNPKTFLIDYDQIRDIAKKFKPLIILAGYSAYPRRLDFKIFREIADEVGAVLMVDMAHFSGLVAGKVLPGNYDPVPFADVVTTTTHKTLRGPRGGMILCKKEFSEQVDKGCPLVMGGPLPHVMAAKSVALKQALSTEFQEYAQQIVNNSQALANSLISSGLNVVTNGTDNHLNLIDVSPLNLTGRQAESVLREAKITLNRNALPFDSNGPWYTSGLRIGTPALTSLGMKESQMSKIADIISIVLSETSPTIIKNKELTDKKSLAKYEIPANIIAKASQMVNEILNEFPVYPEIDLEFLEKTFN